MKVFWPFPKWFTFTNFTVSTLLLIAGEWIVNQHVIRGQLGMLIVFTPMIWVITIRQFIASVAYCTVHTSIRRHPAWALARDRFFTDDGLMPKRAMVKTTLVSSIVYLVVFYLVSRLAAINNQTIGIFTLAFFTAVIVYGAMIASGASGIRRFCAVCDDLGIRPSSK